MKNKLRFFSASICFVLMFLIICIGAGEKKEVSKEEEPLTEETVAPISKEEKSYVVKLNDYNVLTLYEKKSEKILREDRVVSLRENDKKRLLEGIVTSSLEEALLIFEDFVS